MNLATFFRGWGASSLQPAVSVLLPRRFTKKTFSVLAQYNKAADSSRTGEDLGNAELLESPRAAEEAPKSPERNKFPYRKWTVDELRIVKDAHAQGLCWKAITALLPGRSVCAAKAIILRMELGDTTRPAAPSATQSRNSKVQSWTAPEVECLRKLHEGGTRFRYIRPHFPDRTTASIKSALSRFKSDTLIPNKKTRWETEELNYLLKASAEDVSREEIASALHRSVASIEWKAQQIGAQLRSSTNYWSPEEVEMLLKMQRDGAPFTHIAAALGRPARSVTWQFQKIRPSTTRELTSLMRQYSKPLERLSLATLHDIRHLREAGKSWREIHSSEAYHAGSVRRLSAAYHRGSKQHGFDT